MRALAWIGAWTVGAALGWACSTPEQDDGGDCTVGSLDCPCTQGGACDPGLTCLEDRCRNVGVDDTGPDPTTGGMMSTGGTMDGTTGGMFTTGSVDTTMGVLSTGEMDTEGLGCRSPEVTCLDVSVPDVNIPTMGCQAIDMLFVIDGSASMAEERAALAATGAFSQVIMTLEALNGGGIEYRIGVTDDDDHGFLVPPGWFQPDPWFDSAVMSPMEIANAFNGAVGQVGAIGGAATGCEHVLTSGTNLVDGDMSGFVRPDALLVLVLLTDVDDYGAYDQAGGNTCGVGCGTPAPPLADLLNTLVTVKGGLMEGVAAIVVAGDPTVAGGFNFCNQPGSCGCVEVFPGLFDCDIFHATRLYDFAGMLGANGYAADLCGGPASVPTAVETALTSSIEIACQNFDPEG